MRTIVGLSPLQVVGNHPQAENNTGTEKCFTVDRNHILPVLPASDVPSYEKFRELSLSRYDERPELGSRSTRMGENVDQS